jgi:hypothetical protein
MYTILSYSKKKAILLGVVIKPSIYSNKKIDVFKKKVFLCSIGSLPYSDYPTYIQSHGLAYANKRRLLYKKRHENDRHVKNTPGYFADNILW